LQTQKHLFDNRANLILIGNGQADVIKSFKEDTGYDGPVLTDPSLETYRLLNFKKALTSHFGIASMKEGLRAATTGYGKVRIQGTPNQQGGALVIDPDSKILYLYQNKESGDHFSIEDALKACE